jgi:hypothetical protein
MSALGLQGRPGMVHIYATVAARTKTFKSGHLAFHGKSFEMSEHLVEVQRVGIFVMQVESSTTAF